MATCASSAPSGASSSGNLSLASASRRGLLGFAAVAAVAIPAQAFPASTGGLVTSPASKWDVVRARFEAARREVEAYEDETYRPAADRLTKLSGPVPPSRVTVFGVSHWVSDAHRLPATPAYEPVREAKRVQEAHSERNRRLEREIGFGPISDRMATLDAVEQEARRRLMAEPSPDARALAFKLTLAFEVEDLMDGDRAALAADALRLSDG